MSKHYRPFQIIFGKVRISPEIPSSTLFVTQCTTLGRYLPYPYMAHWVTTMHCVGDARNRETSAQIGKVRFENVY